MIGISKLYCGTVEPSDALRYGRHSSHLPSHLLQFAKDKKPVVVWNMTQRCNLKCVHCYAHAVEPSNHKDPISTDQAKVMIDDLAKFGAPVILFSGGLDTKWKEIKPVLWRGVILSTIGVMLTAIIVGYAAYYVLDFSLLEAMLLAAIISSTDAAAVFSILRSKQISLKGDLRPLLELESGSNDPMAIFLKGAVLDTAYISYAIRAIGAIVIVTGLYSRKLVTPLGVKLSFIIGTIAIFFTMLAQQRGWFEMDKTYGAVITTLVVILLSSLGDRLFRRKA